jgi:predicted nuclease with TOPRIM domain
VQVESFLDGDVNVQNMIMEFKSQIEELKKQLAEDQSKKTHMEEMNKLKIQKDELNDRIERLSCLALAAGDARNPIVQQVPLP